MTPLAKDGWLPLQLREAMAKYDAATVQEWYDKTTKMLADYQARIEKLTADSVGSLTFEQAKTLTDDAARQMRLRIRSQEAMAGLLKYLKTTEQVPSALLIPAEASLRPEPPGSLLFPTYEQLR